MTQTALEWNKLTIGTKQIPLESTLTKVYQNKEP
jgi:hypothetical protein